MVFIHSPTGRLLAEVLVEAGRLRQAGATALRREPSRRSAVCRLHALAPTAREGRVDNMEIGELGAAPSEERGLSRLPALEGPAPKMFFRHAVTA